MKGSKQGCHVCFGFAVSVAWNALRREEKCYKYFAPNSGDGNAVTGVDFACRVVLSEATRKM
jgi:hypothetical protein